MKTILLFAVLFFSASLNYVAVARQNIEMPMGGGGSAVFRGDRFHTMLMEMDTNTTVNFHSNGTTITTTSMDGLKIPEYSESSYPETRPSSTRSVRTSRHHRSSPPVRPWWEDISAPTQNVSATPDYTKTPDWNDVLPAYLRD